MIIAPHPHSYDFRPGGIRFFWMGGFGFEGHGEGFRTFQPWTVHPQTVHPRTVHPTFFILWTVHPLTAHPPYTRTVHPSLHELPR